MGVARGSTWAMATKIYKLHNASLTFCQFYKKVVLRLHEHDDVIEMQTIKICPPKVFQQTRSLPTGTGRFWREIQMLPASAEVIGVFQV